MSQRKVDFRNTILIMTSNIGSQFVLEGLSGDADPMTLRRCTVEHPFGTIKAWMGHTHFLTRRLKNVSTEMALNVLAYNIKRVITLIGLRRLMQAIPA